jgi:hypothetical protein
MPDGLTFPFDPAERSSGPCARRETELSLLLDVVFALNEGRPAIAPCLREHGVASRDVALMYDAPFGVDGPSIFELGDLRALLSNPSMTQSAMCVSEPSKLLWQRTPAAELPIVCASCGRRSTVKSARSGALTARE